MKVKTSFQVLFQVFVLTLGSQLIEAKSLEESEYLRFQMDGLLGYDFVEFVIKPSNTSSRDWSGDTNAPLVFYRSISGLLNV